jgi:hypothetical protein
MSSDHAEGRKEIMELVGASWRTIQRHKQRDPRFSQLFRRNKINRKPIVLRDEYDRYVRDDKKPGD